VIDELLPKDAISMNSKVLLSLDGIEEEISLVYPNATNLLEG
jgi:hypothetical protein